MSHRSTEFVDIARQLQDGFRQFMKVPDNWHVLFTQGGACQQYSAIPINLGGHVFGEANASVNIIDGG